MTKEKDKLQLFSKKQILLTAIISGPLSAGYVLARNFQNVKRSRAAKISKVMGYITLFSMYVLMEVIIENFFRANIFNITIFEAYMLVLGLFIVIQAAWASLFYFIIRRLKSFNQLYSNSHSNYSVKTILPLMALGIGSTIALISLQTFLFIFVLVIFLPAIYIYNHLKTIFKSSTVRNLFAVLFFLLAFLFPISQVLIKYFPLTFFNSLLKLGYLFMPFELYAFLGFIFFDIISLILRKTRILSVGHKSFPIANMIGKSVILIIILVTVAYGNWNFNNTKISYYSISVPRKNSELDHLRIAMTADFHLAEITSKNFMEEFVAKINALNADVILLPGDIFESHKQNPEMDFMIQQMHKIKAKYGVYGSIGNHEYYGNFEQKLEFCEKSGIQMIMDTAIVISNSFVLAGRNDRHDKGRKSLEEILNSVSKNLPIILLNHRPDEFENAYKNHIDIHVSGHTHNGQLFPYNYITSLIYDLSWGYKKIKHTNFFVTSGVQGWGPQVRTTAYSEIMLIDVRFVD
jgi:uncharacterized protein